MARHSALYCKLFLRTSRTFEDLFLSLLRTTKGEAHGRRVKTGLMTIDLVLNEDYDDRLPENETRWRYYLDVNPQSGVESNSYKEALKHLLLALRSESVPVVAACDFEDELPQ